MTTITVRNLDTTVADGLKQLGREHGRSMEAEAREILRLAVEKASPATAAELIVTMRARFNGLNIDELDLTSDDLVAPALLFDE